MTSATPYSMPPTRPRRSPHPRPTHSPAHHASPAQDKATAKIPLTRAALEAEVDKVRGAVMIAYPMGLPEWDLVRLALEDDEDLAGTQVGGDRGCVCRGGMCTAGGGWPQRCRLSWHACGACQSLCAGAMPSRPSVGMCHSDVCHGAPVMSRHGRCYC